MDKLTKSNQDIIPVEHNTTTQHYGKVLSIDTSTPEIDFDGILNSALQYINVAEILGSIKKGVQYLVEIPVEHQSSFEAGESWIMENATTGKLWPTLVTLGEDGRNKIVTPLPIKKQEVTHGTPVQDLTQHYHNLYLQRQVNELTGLIQETLNSVVQIERGQLDDRIGQLASGYQILNLSLSEKNPTLKATLLGNAITTISTGQQQTLQTFKRKVSEFSPLPKNDLARLALEVFNPNYLDKKDVEYDHLSEYYALYLQSTRMLADAYAIRGDNDAAQSIFTSAINELKGIDFSSVKTIEYSRKEKDFEKLYSNAAQFMEHEQQLCLDVVKEYDCLSISVNGEKLLEVISDGKNGAVSEQETEQG